jgi:hypothetical protein
VAADLELDLLVLPVALDTSRYKTIAVVLAIIESQTAEFSFFCSILSKGGPEMKVDRQSHPGLYIEAELGE